MNANTSKLVNETNEAYYWLGFLMADGHFSKRKQIQINLGEKDLEHLKKFAKFVEYRKILTKPSLNVGYGQIERQLAVFKIMSNKTYKPCAIKHLTGDKLFSLIVGFLDGDGTISPKGYLRVKCHKSWLGNINFMISYLTGNKKYQGVINKDGLACGCIAKIEIMKAIKQRIQQLKLPVLERKWERVSFEKLSKQEKRTVLQAECFDLFRKGLLPKEVVKNTGRSVSFVYRAFNQYKQAA